MEEEFKNEAFNEEDYGKSEDLMDDFPEDEFNDAEELFKENPLKAIWIKIQNIEEKLDDILNEGEENVD